MKLNGYRASHRNRWKLIQNKILTLQEFVLFEYYLDAMDFDPNHKEFGTFEVFLDEISGVFNRKTDAVRAWHRGLICKGFVQLVDKKRKRFKVESPPRYLTGKASPFTKEEKNNQSLKFLLENICFFPEKVEKNQKNSRLSKL